MQINPSKNQRPSRVQSTTAYTARYEQEQMRRSLMLLSALCLLVPPVGVILVWRAKKIDIRLRGALSALGLVSMTLIFILLMRPTEAVSTIQPIPVTPVQAGYGAAATDVYIAPPVTNVPAQPNADFFGGEPTQEPVSADPASLTAESTVYAVTNNASSYHMLQICDMQENHRMLTLAEAVAEGLLPCEKCATVTE